MKTVGGEYRSGYKNGANPEVMYRVLIDDPKTKLKQAVDGGAASLVIAYWLGARDGFDSRRLKRPNV